MNNLSDIKKELSNCVLHTLYTQTHTLYFFSNINFNIQKISGLIHFFSFRKYNWGIKCIIYQIIIEKVSLKNCIFGIPFVVQFLLLLETQETLRAFN